MPPPAAAHILKGLFVFAWSEGQPRLVGQIEITGKSWPPRDRSSRFRYSANWLNSKFAYPLDTLHLPLVTGWQGSAEGSQLHGIFRDAAPDGWGRFLLEQRYPDVAFCGLEYLAATSDDRSGQLAFGTEPDNPALMDPLGRSRTPQPLLSLQNMQEAVTCLDEGRPLPDSLRPFYDRGSSLGGARPKASVTAPDHSEWIAKFAMRDDPFDVIKIEAACLDMARVAKINVPDFHVETIGIQPVLLARRFDRVIRDNIAHRLGYMSAETLLGVSGESYSTSLSYIDLANSARQIGAMANLDVFRRMLFNVAIGNTDDHLRNHAFVLGPDRQWRLSPAFDLVPHPRRRVMVLRLCHGHAVDPLDAFAAFPSLGLGLDEALVAWQDVAAATRGWREALVGYGVTRTDLEILEPAFASVATFQSQPIMPLPKSLRHLPRP